VPEAQPPEAQPPEATPEAAPAVVPEQPRPAAGIALTRLQQVVARRMAEAQSTIPDFALYADVDMSACVALRGALADVTDPVPTYNDLIVKAAALTLRRHPQANAAFRDGRFERFERVNVGVAVSREDGLVVPTIFDADRRSLGDLAAETARLAAAVRDGSVTPRELEGATFTVSNLGMFGIDAFEAIVSPGQAAILSVGALARRPVVADDGAIVARDVLTLGLACDHRILYGADAARFLRDLCNLLERPLAMAL
jgi:pyruvate dehydrogenase E2 component (dihydrolipoamide acetyltransferase)